VSDLTGWAVAVGGVAVAFWVYSFFRRRSEDRTEKTRASVLVSKASLDQVLYLTAAFLGIGRGGGWRLSLYRLADAADEWDLLARSASGDPYLVNRDSWTVPAESGVLRGLAVRAADGAFDQTPLFPDRTTDEEQWLEFHATWGHQKESASRLKMPTRCYGGLAHKVRVKDGRGVTLGLVVEADYDATKVVATLDQLITRPYFEAVAEFLLLWDEVSGWGADRGSTADYSWPLERIIETELASAHSALKAAFDS